MYISKSGEVAYNLSQLYAIRNTQLDVFLKVMELINTYILSEKIHPHAKVKTNSQFLRQLLDTGWVGSVLVDKTNRQLLGIMLGTVRCELGLVVGSVFRSAVRVSRPGDMGARRQRGVLLNKALCDQILIQYFFEPKGLQTMSDDLLRYGYEQLSCTGELPHDYFTESSCTDMSLLMCHTGLIRNFKWNAEAACLTLV